MKNHLNHPPSITGTTFKCGTATYHLNQSYGEYRLHLMQGGKPSPKAHETAKELDDIMAYLAAAEKMTVQAVEEAYYGLEMA